MESSYIKKDYTKGRRIGKSERDKKKQNKTWRKDGQKTAAGKEVWFLMESEMQRGVEPKMF